MSTEEINRIFAKRILELRKSRSLTQGQLAEILGVGVSTISDWEKEKKLARGGAIQKISDYFKIDKGYLFSDSQEINFPGAIKIKAATATFPVYAHISAGTAIEMIPVDEYVGVPDAIAAKYPNAFFFKVNGDSMDKVIPDGALAMINVCDEAIDNDVVAVTINGNDATLKRLHKFPNGIMLMPESNNETHNKMMFDCSKGECDEVRVIGKLVWYMLPFDMKF